MNPHTSPHVAQLTPANNEAPVQLYKVSDAARVLSISRTVVFELLRSGRLRSVKQGRTRLIPTAAIRDYIALLEKEAEAA
jgi:excisionase family DNA binding protein